MTAGAVLAATLQLVTADNCGQGSHEEKGNFYCQPVKAITYSGVGASNSYNAVTSMGDNGLCTSQPKPYSGPLAPLNEEVSLHFAGPLKLKQFGVYMPGTAKKRRAPSAHDRRHGHQHFHAHDKEIREIQDRAVGDMVVATIDGKVVSWANQYGAAPTSAAAPAAASAASGKPVQNDAPGLKFVQPQTTGKADPQASNIPDQGGNSPSPNIKGDWVRQGYYDAASHKMEGLTFLNHLGDPATSGTWSAAHGNSLSYASSDGTKPASSSLILADCTIPSNNEVVIMSNKKCEGSDCGFVRPGSVNYHGFGGASKIFVFEFAMPSDGQTGWNMDMPAIWMLNANIPRTAQFPKDPGCSCWKSGCGEFDLFEVLNSGNSKAKSTMHVGPENGAQRGGCSDYFPRPTTKTIKAAVVMDGSSSTAHIQILDDNTTFDAALSNEQIKAMTATSSGNDHSAFSLH